MTNRDRNAGAPDLTAKEWGLILTALNAYQHHAVYRALHEKIAPLAKAKGLPLRVAAAPSVPGRNRTRLDRAG